MSSIGWVAGVSSRRLLGHTSIGVWPAPPPSVGEVLIVQGRSVIQTFGLSNRKRRGCEGRSDSEVCMKLSTPIYILKQQAKALSRRESIPLHQALDRIAQREGFGAWSLLSAKSGSAEPASALLDQLRPGELVLLGSRPGQGKTLLSLELAIRTMQKGLRAAFFTLDFTLRDVSDRFEVLGEEYTTYRDRFFIDDSDEICADYIIAALRTASPNTLVIIDYLQLLDQRRQHPDLSRQVRQLKDFARNRDLIIVCLSQIDRSYDSKRRPIPDVGDVRLPNPVDLRLFDRTCFLNGGKMQLASTT